MGKHKIMSQVNYIIDKKGKKWLIDGYYLDKKGMAWTLLVCVDNWKKSKKVKGIL
jgi:hypothetical protein